MRNVALDLGATKICMSEVKNGEIVRRVTVSKVDALMPHLGPSKGRARVAIEACREAWHIYDKLTSWGHDVVIVDTTRVREIGIGRHGKKNDRIDADILALALEQDRIPKAHVLSPERRMLRRELNMRRMLVEQRAQAVTTMRGIVREAGYRVRRCGTEAFRQALEAAKLSLELREQLAPGVEVIKTLEKQIEHVEAKIWQLCDREPVMQRLCSTPGTSLIVAAAFVSVIDEAGRFNNAHQVASYLGLVPKEDSTGGKQRLGRITKAGNRYVRALLIQAAWCVLRRRNSDDPLTLWGQAVAQRRGKRIAVVAIARRLAGVLWAIWRKDTVYDPALVGRASAKGLTQEAQTAKARALGMERAARKLARRRLPSSRTADRKEASALTR